MPYGYNGIVSWHESRFPFSHYTETFFCEVAKLSKKKTTPKTAQTGTTKLTAEKISAALAKRAENGWMRLDNAAKIYPAVNRSTWTPMFRISASLREPVDVDVLQSAAEKTLLRFPGIAVGLKRGVFWNYLDPIREMPQVVRDRAYPCAPMPRRELRKCAVRILHYDNRIAAEFFHSLTDGNGGLVFVKTLVAEYLTQKYGADIPCEDGILDRNQTPQPCELEDSFLKNIGCFSDGSRDPVSYRLRGTKEPDGYLNLTTGIFEVKDVLEKAKSYGVSLTTLVTSVLIESIMELQAEKVSDRRRFKRICVQVPVNLRPFFDSKTLRNFALFVTPNIDPRKGDWSFEEILKAVHHQLGMDLTYKQLNAKMTSNVQSEQSMILKVMPLFIKNIALRFSFLYFGETTFTTTISNLGVIKLPDKMLEYVERMDFVLGPQLINTCNWSANTFGDKLYVSSIRNVREAELERKFFCKMRKLGLHVLIESNQR